MRVVREDQCFAEDYAKQFDWYVTEGGRDVAIRFQEAVKDTINRIENEPTLGRKRRFRHPHLAGLRSIVVTKPFDRILIFYRFDPQQLDIWRMMHGARDLGRRLLEAND
jgi:toxin ParE1/3/4